jgi:co-chaperonin GroES (HSP10)
MIKPIDAVIGMEASEAKKFETLAKSGFEVKTDEQKAKESKGTHHGILVHMGSKAYKELGGDWVKEGDVVIFDRYAGVEIELPPGSGEKYRFTNDESILGVMK